jgi:hypothetical protein
VVARFLVRVKDDLVVNGETLSITASVHNAYKSPGYVDSHRPSWLIVASGKVVEVFSEDVELLSVSSIREDEVPQSVLEYTVPDHRGFTTMPYQVDR